MITQKFDYNKVLWKSEVFGKSRNHKIIKNITLLISGHQFDWQADFWPGGISHLVFFTLKNSNKKWIENHVLYSSCKLQMVWRNNQTHPIFFCYILYGRCLRQENLAWDFWCRDIFGFWFVPPFSHSPHFNYEVAL